jgi:integrase
MVFRNVADAVEPPKGRQKAAKAYERTEAARFDRRGRENAPLASSRLRFRDGAAAGGACRPEMGRRPRRPARGDYPRSDRTNPKANLYKSTKTGRVARIALSDHALEALRAQRVQQAKDKLSAGPAYDYQGFVFAPPGGGMPSPQAITHAIRRIAKRAGTIGLGVHSMRHSTGTWLIRAGVEVRTVAALLRHSSPTTTLNVYAHEVEGAQADAVRHLLGASGNRMATANGSDPKIPS